jgi:hypothetical protein
VEKQTTYFIKWHTGIKNLLSCQLITASKCKNMLKQYLSFRLNYIQDASDILHFFQKVCSLAFLIKLFLKKFAIKLFLKRLGRSCRSYFSTCVTFRMYYNFKVIGYSLFFLAIKREVFALTVTAKSEMVGRNSSLYLQQLQ